MAATNRGGQPWIQTVYLAHDKKHDRKVAIKILHAELAAVLGAERSSKESKSRLICSTPISWGSLTRESEARPLAN